MKTDVKNKRRRGYTRISSKHQVTIPTDAIRQAGLHAGDNLRVEVRGPGELVFVRATDPIDRFAGSLTGAYPANYLDELRREWD